MSRSLLIDSDVLIDHLRKDRQALDFLSRELDAGTLLFISVISRTDAKSHSLSIGDALIAATCCEMGLTLVTRNIKHYPMKDIGVVKPY